ncbi:MAG: hypothetical protein OXS33_01865 [bacterium]|nr:hypothetical protein [bacterium]
MMNLKRYLPTRRELIRDVSIGVAVAGAAGFGAAKLFPSEASAATEAEIKKITDNGAITLGPLGSRNLGTSHRLLSGESVTFEAPSSSEIANSTAYILGSTPDGVYGFQATQKGFALYGHGPDFPLNLNGTVSLQGGTLAHYTIRNRTSGSQHLALWQSAHHDLYTYIPDSLADAVSLLSRFNLTDSASGLTAIPKSASGHSIEQTSLTVEFGDHVAEVFKVGDAERPSWQGQAGVGGDFYSDDGEVLLFGDSAAVRIASWASDSVTDSDLGDMVSNLRVTIGS